MAKGSTNGVIRGKKGNTVYYKITNSNNKEKQGWREYNATVGNPQTNGQIDQRVKLQAVNNLYRALKPIIQRGWENHKYGDDSRRAFLKLALGASFKGPYIEKGSTLAVPIKNVPVMYGSLTPIVMEASSNGDAVLTNVPATLEAPNTVTQGEVSQALIAAGVAQEGDQITFVVGYLNGAGTVSYITLSFYVTVSATDLMLDLGIPIYSTQYDDFEAMVLDVTTLIGRNSTYAVLCSVSRDGDDAGVHLRSVAEFDMTTEFDNYFYGNAATKKAAAKASYIKTRTANTNWEQVPGGESGGGGGGAVTAFTLSGTEIVPGSLTNVAAEPAEIVDANGQHYFVRAHTSAGGTRYLYGQGGGDFTSSATAPTGATNANTIDPCAANNVASGCRAWLLAKGVSADLLVIA